MRRLYCRPERPQPTSRTRRMHGPEAKMPVTDVTGIGFNRHAQRGSRMRASGSGLHLRNVSSCSSELLVTSRNSARFPLSLCIWEMVFLRHAMYSS